MVHGGARRADGGAAARLGRRSATGATRSSPRRPAPARRSRRFSPRSTICCGKGLAAPLPDEVRVVYVSPLKALSADIHKNLAEPRRGIRAARRGRRARRAADHGGGAHRRHDAVRARGDAADAAAHPGDDAGVAVSAADGGAQPRRCCARCARSSSTRFTPSSARGAARTWRCRSSGCSSVAERPLLRIGLSATQKPIEEVARFLVGHAATTAAAARSSTKATAGAWISASRCRGSPLDAVMSHEVWEEYYDRLAALIRRAPDDARVRQHAADGGARRAAPERAARRRRGHGASRQPVEGEAARRRDAAEDRAAARRSSRRRRSSSASTSGTSISSARSDRRTGSRRCCSASAARATPIAGHAEGPAVPGVARRPGRVRGAAARRSGAASSTRIVSHDAPLDVLAQQIVAESACREYARGRALRAGPARVAVSRAGARRLRRGRRGWRPRASRRGAAGARRSCIATRSTRRVRGRRGARLLALTSGGAIPEVADYRVVLEPDDTFIGTLNEDFAIESMAGDVFQLGNASWRVLQVARRRRARRRREGRAADDSVLARRGAGAQRRAVARGQRSARGRRSHARRDRRIPARRDGRACRIASTG